MLEGLARLLRMVHPSKARGPFGGHESIPERVVHLRKTWGALPLARAGPSCFQAAGGGCPVWWGRAFRGAAGTHLPPGASMCAIG